jgi:hypothetical protein
MVGDTWDVDAQSKETCSLHGPKFTAEQLAVAYGEAIEMCAKAAIGAPVSGFVNDYRQGRLDAASDVRDLLKARPDMAKLIEQHDAKLLEDHAAQEFSAGIDTAIIELECAENGVHPLQEHPRLDVFRAKLAKLIEAREAAVRLEGALANHEEECGLCHCVSQETHQRMGPCKRARKLRAELDAMAEAARKSVAHPTDSEK